jgi:hypothetical protein
MQQVHRHDVTPSVEVLVHTGRYGRQPLNGFRKYAALYRKSATIALSETGHSHSNPPEYMFVQAG